MLHDVVGDQEKPDSYEQDTEAVVTRNAVTQPTLIANKGYQKAQEANGIPYGMEDYQEGYQSFKTNGFKPSKRDRRFISFKISEEPN